MNNYVIREIHSDEIHLLEDFLYEAIYQPDGSNLLPRSIIEEPQISVYIDGWGEKDDLCLVAEVQDRIVGAVWTRILAGEIKGYGNVDDETPEFAISLFKEYRNQGIGTNLMKSMIGLLKEMGYQKTSLSVAKDNYASKMYKDLGFKVVNENEDDFLMLLQLR